MKKKGLDTTEITFIPTGAAASSTSFQLVGGNGQIIDTGGVSRAGGIIAFPGVALGAAIPTMSQWGLIIFLLLLNLGLIFIRRKELIFNA